MTQLSDICQNASTVESYFIRYSVATLCYAPCNIMEFTTHDGIHEIRLFINVSRKCVQRKFVSTDKVSQISIIDFNEVICGTMLKTNHSWVILLVYCIVQMLFKDAETFFLRNSRTGKCISTGRFIYSKNTLL
ncbi:uncharacterized protein LOC114531902 [Dendronephthya gigantea]|uniref:uncharacterized protein LOC114531902 n=1 Tax=Dendronephthya gigantea TaxID=151771 RepID=UPI00106C7A06|nr:uncharacterized protein LOC114531902 [Dendronephthya gigantea]